MRRLLAAPVLALLLSACSNLLSQKQAALAPSGQDIRSGETITLPAQLRTMTRRSMKGSFISCAEPGPDVALSDTFKLVTAVTSERAATANDGAASSASSSNRKGSLSNDLQTSTTALELAGRTQTVLLAREFLFRTCEAAANGWLDDKAVTAAHDGTLKQIAGMVAADAKKAETAGVVATAAAIQLDARILASTSGAVQAAVIAACTSDFEACMSKPGVDEKGRSACRASLATCVKP